MHTAEEADRTVEHLTGSNALLLQVLDWADEHGVSLDNATVSLSSGPKPRADVSFYHWRETHENLRQLKRGVDGLEAVGKPPNSYFEKRLKYGDLNLVVSYHGAMECEITYHCTPRPFHDGTPAERELPSLHQRETVQS